MKKERTTLLHLWWWNSWKTNSHWIKQ